MIPFSPDDDLAALRRKIKLNGYHFTVARNWVVDLSPNVRGRMRSRHFPARALSRAGAGAVDPGPVAAFSEESLPARFDWRNFNGRSYIGPIRNQGSCGSCYAFGACAAAEGSYNRAAGRYNAACVDFSEAFISFCLDDFYEGFTDCIGSDYDYQELDALVAYGLCWESAFPYGPQVRQCPLPQPFPEVVRCRAWYRLPCGDLEMIKAAIYHFGVVDAAVLTTRAFDAYASGIYEDTSIDCESDPCFYAETDHIVSLVGWDDNQGEYSLRFGGCAMRHAAGCGLVRGGANARIRPLGESCLCAFTGVVERVDYRVWFWHRYGCVTMVLVESNAPHVGFVGGPG